MTSDSGGASPTLQDRDSRRLVFSYGAATLSSLSDNQAQQSCEVAAGQAETINACGADVRPRIFLAVGSEAGTRRGVA